MVFSRNDQEVGVQIHLLLQEMKPFKGKLVWLFVLLLCAVGNILGLLPKRNDRFYGSGSSTVARPLPVGVVWISSKPGLLDIYIRRTGKGSQETCGLIFVPNMTTRNATNNTTIEQEINLTFSTGTPARKIYQRLEPVITTTPHHGRDESSAVIELSQSLLVTLQQQQHQEDDAHNSNNNNNNTQSFLVDLVATFGTSLDVSDAHHWPDSVAVKSDCPEPELLVAKHSLSLTLVMEACGMPYVLSSSANKNDSKSRADCESDDFITGEESTQGWWNETEWFPDNKAQGLCRFQPASIRNMNIAILGDSQGRTLFGAMLQQVCEPWSIFDYSNLRTADRAKTWCKNPHFTAIHPRPEWHIEDICQGFFDVWGDGCWHGGAKWQSHATNSSNNNAGSTTSRPRDSLVYVDLHSVNDRRFLGWNFTNFPKIESAISDDTYDIIIVSTELHDANLPLSEDETVSSQDWNPLESPYGNGLASLLQVLKSRHKGPILLLGAWSTVPKQRRSGFWWAASSTRTQQLSRVAKAVAAQHETVWRMDMMRPSMAYRHMSPDGVHLFYPNPLSELARLVWHNVAILTQRPSKPH